MTPQVAAVSIRNGFLEVFRLGVYSLSRIVSGTKLLWLVAFFLVDSKTES